MKIPCVFLSLCISETYVLRRPVNLMVSPVITLPTKFSLSSQTVCLGVRSSESISCTLILWMKVVLTDYFLGVKYLEIHSFLPALHLVGRL